MSQKKVLFELCCGSTADVIAAQRAGADRVELNSSMFLGGITPSVGSLLVAKQHTTLPIMCMVRPREGGFCYTDFEFQTMKADARALINAGANGIVFGILKEDGRVDIPRCREIMEICRGKITVFHRAIDVTPDWQAALEDIISLGCTRVLTSGQAPTVSKGLPTIKAMIAQAAGRIEILPGGGIEIEDAAHVAKELNVPAVHAMVHALAFDKSAMGNPAIYFGGAIYPPEDRYLTADENAIARFIEEVNPS